MPLAGVEAEAIRVYPCAEGGQRLIQPRTPQARGAPSPGCCVAAPVVEVSPDTDSGW
jgi:hypothetical protein